LEAKIYLNLLRVGPISASALAKEIDIERTKMYRTIEKLIQHIFMTKKSYQKNYHPYKTLIHLERNYLLF